MTLRFFHRHLQCLFKCLPIGDRLRLRRSFPFNTETLTQLQADAFITLDAKLARSLEGIVTTASIDALR